MSQSRRRADPQVKIRIATDGLQYHAQQSRVVGWNSHCIVIKFPLCEINALVAREGVAIGVQATVADHRQSQPGGGIGLSNRRHHPERTLEGVGCDDAAAEHISCGATPFDLNVPCAWRQIRRNDGRGDGVKWSSVREVIVRQVIMAHTHGWGSVERHQVQLPAQHWRPGDGRWDGHLINRALVIGQQAGCDICQATAVKLSAEA